MKNVKVYLDTFKYDFEEVNSMVAIVWSVKYKANFLQTKTIKGINYINYYFILNMKEIILEHLLDKKDRVIISLSYKDYIYKFKKFYHKYLKKHINLKKKYTDEYKSISKKHETIIMKFPEIRQVIDLYLIGYLMYSYTGGTEINLFKRKEKDDFLKQIDIYRKEKPLLKNNDEILSKLIGVFSKFPKFNKEFLVWRGLDLDKKFKKGDEITQMIPFGTSLFPYVARDFIKNSCCLLEIEVPKKYPAIFISEYDSWQEEVLLKQCVMRVKSVKKIKKRNLYMHLKDVKIPFLKSFEKDQYFDTDLKIIRCEIIEEL